MIGGNENKLRREQSSYSSLPVCHRGLVLSITVVAARGTVRATIATALTAPRQLFDGVLEATGVRKNVRVLRVGVALAAHVDSTKREFVGEVGLTLPLSINAV